MFRLKGLGTVAFTLRSETLRGIPGCGPGQLGGYSTVPCPLTAIRLETGPQPDIDDATPFIGDSDIWTTIGIGHQMAQ